jgi:hypothetical protein
MTKSRKRLINSDKVGFATSIPNPSFEDHFAVVIIFSFFNTMLPWPA